MQSLTLFQRAECFDQFIGEDGVKHGASFMRGHNARGEQTIYGTWLGGQDYRNKSTLYGAYPRGYLERALSLFPDAKRILHLFSGSLTAKQVDEAWSKAHEGTAVWKMLNATKFGQKVDTRIEHSPTQLRFDNARHPASAAAKPDIIGNAEHADIELNIWMSKQPKPEPVALDLILADPPYRLSDQRRYWREAMMSLDPADVCTRCGMPPASHRPVYLKSTREGYLTCPRVHGGIRDGMEIMGVPRYVRFKPLQKKLVIQQCAAVLQPGGFLVWLDEIRPPYDNGRWIFRGGATVLRSTGHRVRFAAFLERRS